MITKKLIKPISKVGVANANVSLDNYYTKPQVDSKLDAKQDTLTAGANITIKGNVISANVSGSGGNVDLSNYYTKSEVDGKITTIDSELATKQDTLIEGNNITIQGNTISANVDLSDYYTKTQIDSQVNTINGEINTKQDKLIAGNNITISNNEISANVNLDNYYNKQEIDTTINSVKGNVANNTNDITNLKTKDTQLESVINTNKQNITTNTSDIATIKTQQATQDQQISSNRALSNQIIEGLKTLRVFNYIGTFNSTTTYKRNDVVDYNNRLFLSKVDNNVGNTPPSDNQSNTYWLLVDGIQASVDLSGYYTKIEVNNKLQDYLAITTFNQTIQEIQTKQGEQDTLIGQKANTSDLDNYYTKPQIDSKITSIDSELATKQNTLTAGSNISISNNIISANIPPVDLSNYYNKQEIDTTINSVKGNVANNTNDITNLKTKDTQLESVINTNKQNITTNTSDIATIKTQQATQDQQISSNRALSNQIIEGLKTLRVFNYIGTFNSTTTYKRNDVVDYNNRLFLSKVDNNVGNTPPSDNQSNTYWLLVDGIQASVDLSGYYTKIEVNNKLQDYLAITTFNQTIQEIQTKQGEQDTLIGQKANTSDLANYYNRSEVDGKVNTINGEIATKQNTLTAGNNITIQGNVISANVNLDNYYNKTQIDGKVDTINNTLNGKANTSDLNSYAKLNETNNGEFFIGDKNGKHIWFAKPFQYGGNTYSSMKIRNGGTNYFTMEHNFNTNQSIISNPRGSIQLKNIAAPTENNDGVNKQYVDTKIASIPTTDLTNYYTKSEVNEKVNGLIKTTTFESQSTFHYVDGLNVNSQRYRWYRVDTSNTPLNANNCLNIEYKTTDSKEITFSYKWENDTSILLTFCKVNGQQDYRAIGTLIAKYI